ncbi:MAG: molybdopterin-dependent oxidoreductase [Bacteroidota bacterium]
MSTAATHYRTCNLCEAMCGLKIEYQDRRVLSIRGDKEDPFSRGHICPKAVALQDIYEDKDRLQQPVRRTAGGWETISWEAAYDEVATRLRQINEQYGPNSIGSYLGNPNVHNIGSLLNIPNFLRSLNSRNRFSASSADQLPHHFAALQLFGHSFLIPIPDLDHTDHLLILGANPLVSNGSLMTAPDIGKRLKAIQKRGGKIIVIDPRRTETAEKADVHHFIRPGTDALLLMAMVNTLYKERLVKPERLVDFTNGFGKMEIVADPFTPEKVASLVGIPAQQIRALTREFAKAKTAVCYGRMGLSTQAFGGLCQWLIIVLNLLTGNLDRRGGALFTLPAFDHVGMQGAAGRGGSYARWHSRVSGMPESNGELPVAAMAEEILTPGEGQIKAMVTMAGNPVLSTPNGPQVDKALAQLEFMVAIDIYINETTRHADIILPPTTGLECEHYDLIFHIFAIRNTAKYSPALFEKTAAQRHDWKILQNLTRRLTDKPVPEQSPAALLAMVLEGGPYREEGLTMDKLREEPHGVDLGPLQPCLPERLFTPKKQIWLVPELMEQDVQRLKARLDAKAPGDFPFLLIGRRLLRSNNSWMHNAYRLVKGPNQCTLLLHPRDAEGLQVENGQQLCISSRVGSLKVEAEISDEVMEGVVSLPHGFGHSYEGTQMEIAAQHSGQSINDLTDERLLDQLTGNAAFNGVPVRLDILE